MSRAIQDLTREHQAILAALQTLAKISAGAADTLVFDADDVRDFIGFLQEFADKCHHGKEEGLLFPAVVAAGVPPEGGIIEELLREHTLAREHIAAMQAGLQADDAARLAGGARQYILLLRTHIQKENAVFFPQAEQVLSQQRLEELYDAFEAHEELVIGHGRHEELHAVLERLHAKYQA